MIAKKVDEMKVAAREHIKCEKHGCQKGMTPLSLVAYVDDELKVVQLCLACIVEFVNENFPKVSNCDCEEKQGDHTASRP